MTPITQQCGTARRVALQGGPRRLDEAVAIHLARCPACKDFLAGEAAMGRALAEAAPAPRAPAAVRARVFEAVALHRRTRQRRRTLLGGLAAAALLAALGYTTLTMTPASSSDALATTVVDDFVRLHGREGIRTGEVEVAERWLGTQADVAITAPQWGGATLVRARICPMPSGRGAVLEYQVGAAEIDYYVLPATGRGRDQFAVTTVRGYAVVAWRTGDVWHAAVSRLPADELHRLVRTLETAGTPTHRAPDHLLSSRRPEAHRLGTSAWYGKERWV